MHTRTPAQPHSLRTARHVQAQRESRVTTQHLRSCLCQKAWCLQLPPLPPRMFLRRCPASALRSSWPVAAVALFCAGVSVLWQRDDVVYVWSLALKRTRPAIFLCASGCISNSSRPSWFELFQRSRTLVVTVERFVLFNAARHVAVVLRRTLCYP